MKKALSALVVLIVLSGALYAGYALTKNLPVYDQFYKPEERSARDLKRIALTFPNSIGDYVLQPFTKSSDLVQSYDGCNDKNGQGTEDVTVATLCEREIFAHYRNPATNQDMTIDFLSITKGEEEVRSRAAESFTPTTVNGWSVFRFKKDTDNEILWYPADARNPLLERIHWYPERSFMSIAAQVSSGSNYGETINTNDPVLSYFLENYPPAK